MNRSVETCLIKLDEIVNNYKGLQKMFSNWRVLTVGFSIDYGREVLSEF